MAAKKTSLWNRITGRIAGPMCFIAYSHRDGAHYARALYSALSRQGIDCWRDDENLELAVNWADVIRNSLQSADIFILIGTACAFQSPHVLSELDFFSRKRRPILPILFRSTPTDDIPPLIKGLHWLLEDEETLTLGPRDSIPKIIEAIEQLCNREHFTRYPTPTPPKNAQRVLLNEGKLILVGRGEAGKTSIVRRLVENSFHLEEPKTQGIEITRWPFSCDNDTIQLNIWDFGGQEIMHATHQFFLTERSLYLIVINGREGGEETDTEYWLKHIQSFGGDSPVIVVLNKANQHPFELNYRGLQAKYPQIRFFVKTDCKEGVGIDLLSSHIKEVAKTMPEIRMRFHLDWFKVKESIEARTEDFMSYETFLQVCHNEGIRDESDLDTLCWVLHCLGIALNFRDDSRLNETSILKPKWVTEGIYKILNDPKLAARRGELHLADLSNLLPKHRYPLNKHQFLLELMRKFSLCFAFPENPNKYLIPELLGKEEPKQTREFEPTICLNFEYHYSILPEGLIPRFIVRTHTLSRDQERWRTGAILAHEGVESLVQADYERRRVIVRVKGGDATTRRQLLAIIRYDLEKINNEFKDKLDVQPKIPLKEDPEFSIDYRKLTAFEKQGVKEFPEFINQSVVSIQVKELLDGVDLEQHTNILSDHTPRAKSIFFSYSHRDEPLRDELETHLKLLQRQGIISTWHDRKILSGEEWNHEIDREMESADIILLLISANFLASDYCWNVEVTRAMERHASQSALVIPILLKSCDWQDTPFAKIQGLPVDMRPVAEWESRDAAWTGIAKAIRGAARTGCISK